jgi:hypothetical protein
MWIMSAGTSVTARLGGAIRRLDARVRATQRRRERAQAKIGSADMRRVMAAFVRR